MRKDVGHTMQASIIRCAIGLVLASACAPKDQKIDAYQDPQGSQAVTPSLSAAESPYPGPDSGQPSAAGALDTRDCDRHKDHLKVAAPSHLNWLTKKKKVIPVIGKHQVAGTINLKGSGLEDASGELTFDEKSMTSDIAIRDERILKYVFGYDEGHRIRFEVTSITSEKGELPSAGNTAVAQVKGQLWVGGKDHTINLVAMVTGTEWGFHVLSGENVNFNLFEEWELKDEIDALLKLVDVTMEATIKIQFELNLQYPCKD